MKEFTITPLVTSGKNIWGIHMVKPSFTSFRIVNNTHYDFIAQSTYFSIQKKHLFFLYKKQENITAAIKPFIVLSYGAQNVTIDLSSLPEQYRASKFRIVISGQNKHYKSKMLSF